MKNLLLLPLVFIPLFLLSQDPFLPNPHSQEELEKIRKGLYPPVVKPSKTITAPPPKPVRHMAEWEELEALVITWQSFPEILSQIVKYAKEEVRVIIIVENDQDRMQAEGHLSSIGVALDDNIEFVTARHNSVWSRDYAQTTVYADEVGERYFTDWVYDRIRPDDDTVAVAVADYLGAPLYSTTEAENRLSNAGGNFMSDGLGNGFCSKLILQTNGPGNIFSGGALSEFEIDGIMQAYMGINRFVKFDTLPWDIIHHLDMHMHLLDEETFVVGQYPEGVADGPQIEANINYLLDHFESAFGSPYQIKRIVQPPDFQGNYPDEGAVLRNYTNFVFINKTILVPTYEERYDRVALRFYREYFPGYKVVGINCNNMIAAVGALHCITKEVGTSDPLWIVHQRQRDISDNAVWGDYELSARFKHRTGISSAKLFWTTDPQLGYEPADMSLTNYFTGEWTASIPHQADGTEIFYYVQGTAFSGKTQVRPLPAPAAYYHFKVDTKTTATTEAQAAVLENIYPNPASGITVVPVLTNEKIAAKIELTDVAGRLVELLFEGTLPPGKTNVYLHAEQYAAGVYFVNLKTEGGVVSRKVVVK
ncbi:MAG TPA: T9SS type A sorting domain-containing protein [Bacteroidetes bacterium]|nr:T9SS type A sorting domain-containing protein [Bacteroidota bacterium]